MLTEKSSSILICLAALTATLVLPPAMAADAPQAEPGGTIHVPAFDLPESSYLSAETRAALKHVREEVLPSFAAMDAACPPMASAKRADMTAIRQCQAEFFYKTPFYKSVRARYAVEVKPETIGGVYTEVFTPKEGIAPDNKARVLINVHGGGFYAGARTNSHLESIPIASVGRIKIVSIDYRMAPEYTFPAANEDVAAVYKELLKTYKPGNIGLYGCSAGGALVAQSVAWFLKNNLPLPGAVGMFCYGAPTATTGDINTDDSAAIVYAIMGMNFKDVIKTMPDYFHGVDRKNPLASPGDYDEVMAKFPPSLLISGTRDFLLSSEVVTHAQLTRLGVDAELHVWEGMQHAFLFFPEIPESREAYNVIVKFFDRHLGK